ncbi:hypothetical protein A3F02_02760 [Candidatus Curtissbacteria bacterium RIFCSPHIGHO2_12_FULL_38_9b]|uniref:Glycosyltransferase 2-like domain-containing protein n=2 Tax=Candidatus Curtissiibacteriota TaxID=1752717 RepID=A0A1F5GZ01_9BACT|nr:MAG: hypothetical protein A3A48_03360 [Candidatus Curtissbacteria bacterium RIFCSPLOWO2_01_FULL_37_9]OGD97024.1 MAG: hypothetical protein A3F02_02760 [Candidatus Curtissbacteria bacterium RIFCSPHIGHO2_12_FULL_38_9b]
MDLAIVIVSYNTKELLAECLHTLLVASRGIRCEINVIDNNSSDGTVDMIKTKFPQINLIANLENKGFSKANNQILKKVKSRYALILNPDTIMPPDTLKKMISYMDANLDVAVSTCRVELLNGELDKDCRRHFPSPWRAFCHFSKLSLLFKNTRIFDSYYMGYISVKKEHEIDSCVGAFMMLRVTALKKVGYFDEDFFFYGEDLDLCWRFKEAGYKIIYNPAVKIIHYKGAASGMKSTSSHLTKVDYRSKKRAVQESTRAMKLFYKKHYMNKYPSILTWFILMTIKITEQIRLMRI